MLFEHYLTQHKHMHHFYVYTVRMIVIAEELSIEFCAMARELLTSDEGLMRRSRSPIEPEAVFGQIKYDYHFKRFSHRGMRLVNAELSFLISE